MSVLQLLLFTSLSLLALAVTFRPLEWAFPAKPGQRFFRPDWLTDLAFFAGQYLLWNGLVLAGIAAINGWVGGVLPGWFRSAVASQPWWLQVVEVGC